MRCDAAWVGHAIIVGGLLVFILGLVQYLVTGTIQWIIAIVLGLSMCTPTAIVRATLYFQQSH